MQPQPRERKRASQTESVSPTCMLLATALDSGDQRLQLPLQHARELEACMLQENHGKPVGFGQVAEVVQWLAGPSVPPQRKLDVLTRTLSMAQVVRDARAAVVAQQQEAMDEGDASGDSKRPRLLGNGGTPTSEFACPKCGGTDCEMTTTQIRRRDEAPTPDVMCRNPACNRLIFRPRPGGHRHVYATPPTAPPPTAPPAPMPKEAKEAAPTFGRP